MLLVLGPSPDQQRELRELMESQHDKASPNYHRWLTPNQFARQFGPLRQDIEAVESWLRGQGFTVAGTAQSGQWIEFSGTAQQVENAFRTKMRRYHVGEQDHIANAEDVSLPVSLAPVVRGVLSLNNFFKKPLIKSMVPMPAKAGQSYSSERPFFTTNNGAHAMGPSDFETIYNLTPLIQNQVNGFGQTIAVVARRNIQQSDITDFRSIFGIGASSFNVTVNGVDPGFDANDRDTMEATLDTEWAGAVARQATVQLVVSASTATTDGIDLSSAFIVDGNLAQVMSVSFGACEADLGPVENAFYNNLWQQAAAQGISVIVAAGDNGAGGCDDPGAGSPATVQAVNGLASTPFNTAVGGTEFNEGATPSVYWAATNTSATQESAIGYIPEEVWNESCSPPTPNCTALNLFAGSGGKSTLYSKPNWQSLTVQGVPNDASRDVPDIALSAALHDPYLICFAGSCSGSSPHFLGIGGTSASAPAFAGIMAIVDQAKSSRQGLANYLLYRIASSENFSTCDSSLRTNPQIPTNCVFNDVTTGNNSVPGLMGFSAGVGYDLASGLGSMDVNNLVSAWKALTLESTSTTLTPASISGTHGQPITLSVQVTGANPPSPTGSVSLVIQTCAFPICPATVVSLSQSSGTSSNFNGPVNSLSGGSYQLIAHYAGDASFAPSDSSAISVTITPEASTVALSSFTINSSGAPIQASSFPYGSFMDLHAQVTSASGQGVATGQVQLTDTSTNPPLFVGSAPLNQKGEGELIFTSTNGTTSLTVGVHSITGNYLGDNSLNSSASASPLNITVTKGNPGVGVSPLTNSADAGQPFQVIVGVGPTGPILPTGTVQLFDNGTQVGPAGQLSSDNATARITISLATDGQHTLTSTYSGDNTYNPATSSGVSMTINPPFAFSLHSPGSVTVTAGQTASYSLAVSADSGFTGTVAISCLGSPVGTVCTTSPASATFTTPNTSVEITVSVATTTNANLMPTPLFKSLPVVFAGLLAGVLLIAAQRRKQAMLLVLASLLVGMSACGGGGSASSIPRSTAPPTTATLTVTGTSGGHTATFPLSLTILH